MPVSVSFVVMLFMHDEEEEEEKERRVSLLEIVCSF